MKRSACVSVIAMIAFGLPSAVHAWGSIGHRVVGQVADQHLSPQAASATSRIVGTNSLGDVANWMDEVRGTSEGQRMRPWHYDSVDVCAPAPATCRDDDCASHRIERAIETLKREDGETKASRARQLKALRVLVHLVGDVHQPLHAAENHDGGGNAVIIENRWCIDYRTNQPVQCNLHTYWDNSLVKAAKGQRSEREFVEALAAMSVPSGGDAAAWIVESNGRAKDHVHVYEGFACGAGGNRVSLAADYDAQAVPVVEQQLATAGARLAAVLNAIYR